MAFARPTLSELITRATSDLVTRLSLATPLLRRSFVGYLAKTWAALVNGLHGHIAWAARQLFVHSCDDDQLDGHGNEIGVLRIPPEAASGLVVLAGTNGYEVPAGTILQRSDRVKFSTDDDATIALGVATVSVTALVAGVDGNTEAGVELTFVTPVAGVQSSAEVDVDGITGGVDRESTESYRARILDRKRRKPQGGAVRDFEQWAKEVAGVTRVWVKKGWMGPGTVGVLFVLDGQEDIIPDGAKVAEVQAYIDDPTRCPVGCEAFVVAPEAVPVDFSIALNPSTAAAKAAVEAALTDYLLRAGEPEVTLPLSNLDEAISSAPGEISHVMSEPSTDPTFGANQIPVMGTLTWL